MVAVEGESVSFRVQPLKGSTRSTRWAYTPAHTVVLSRTQRVFLKMKLVYGTSKIGGEGMRWI